MYIVTCLYDETQKFFFSKESVDYYIDRRITNDKDLTLFVFKLAEIWDNDGPEAV